MTSKLISKTKKGIFSFVKDLSRVVIATGFFGACGWVANDYYRKNVNPPYSPPKYAKLILEGNFKGV